MPVFYEPGDVSGNSRIDKDDVPDALPAVGLEEVTGADWLVTSSPMPADTEFLIRLHIEQGARMIQRKSALDLFSSIADGRINNSLAKMHAMGAAWYQCVLVTTGIYDEDREGYAIVGQSSFTGKVNEPYVHWQRQKNGYIKYSAVHTKLVEWMQCGAYMPLRSDEDFPAFIASLKRMMNEPATRDIWPKRRNLTEENNDSLTNPFQRYQRVEDGREVLYALGLGPKQASQAIDCWGTPAVALMWLSNPELYDAAIYPRLIRLSDVKAIYAKLRGNVVAKAMEEA